MSVIIDIFFVAAPLASLYVLTSFLHGTLRYIAFALVVLDYLTIIYFCRKRIENIICELLDRISCLDKRKMILIKDPDGLFQCALPVKGNNIPSMGHDILGILVIKSKDILDHLRLGGPEISSLMAFIDHGKDLLRLPMEEISNVGYLLTQLVRGVADYSPPGAARSTSNGSPQCGQEYFRFVVPVSLIVR